MDVKRHITIGWRLGWRFLGIPRRANHIVISISSRQCSGAACSHCPAASPLNVYIKHDHILTESEYEGLAFAVGCAADIYRCVPFHCIIRSASTRVDRWEELASDVVLRGYVLVDRRFRSIDSDTSHAFSTASR